MAGGIDQPIVFSQDGTYQALMTIPFDYNEFVNGAWTSKSSSASTSLTIRVRNVAPTITQIQSDQSAKVGQSFNYFVTATDPGMDTLSYAWDLDGDAHYDDAFNSQGTFSFGTVGRHTVAVAVTHNQSDPVIRGF